MWRHCVKTDIFVHRPNFVTGMWGVSCEVRTEQLALFIGTAHSQYRLLYLGAKLRKMTISFVMSVCPHGTTRLPLDGFSWNLIFEYFQKIFKKSEFYWNLTRITGTLHEDYYKMRNVPNKNCRVNQKSYFIFNDLLSKSCCLLDDVENYRRTGQATDDNMAQAHFTLDA